MSTRSNFDIILSRHTRVIAALAAALLGCALASTPAAAQTNPAGTTLTTGIVGGATVINNGTIAISASSSYGISDSTPGAVVTNNGVMSTTGGSTYLINLTGGGEVVTNNGTITSTLGYADPIHINAEAASGTSTSITVNNAGTITTASSSNMLLGNSAIGASTFDVTNSGVMTSTGYANIVQQIPSGLTNNTLNVTNTATGTMTSFAGIIATISVTLNNAGTITQTGLNNSAVGTYVGSANVTNSGVITGDWAVQPAGNGGGGTSSVINSGTIASNVVGGSGIAIDYSSVTGSTIANSGTLTGTVMLGGSNSLTVLGNAARIGGDVLPSAGTSGVMIGTAGTSANFTGTGQFGTAAGSQTREGYTYSVAPLGTFAVASGSSFSTGAGFGLNAATVSEAGTFNTWSAVSATAASWWDQSGALDFGETGGTVGQLSVSGAMDFEAGSSLGIASGSSLTPGFYTDVLSTTGTTGLPTDTSGSFGGDSYVFSQEAGDSNMWDLTVTAGAQTTDAPEPASAAVLLAGMAGLGVLRRRRRA
jgi:fibronectin-binding autotransporter adhesin